MDGSDQFAHPSHHFAGFVDSAAGIEPFMDVTLDPTRHVHEFVIAVPAQGQVWLGRVAAFEPNVPTLESPSLARLRVIERPAEK